MSDHVSSPGISRRSLLRGGAAAVPVAAGLLPSFFAAGCTAGPASATPRASSSPPRPGTGIANVHVSHDHYGVHVEPSVAANPAHPRQLLVACQASPTVNPELIATYFSFDAGASWQNGALPQPPAGQAPASDDVTVAFDSHGRGYLCASRAGNTPGGRALYVWRTDDGGRSFSAPVTLVAGQYFDHPGIAVGIGQAPSEHNVYVVWAAAGNSPSAPTSALSFTRSTDGGQSFEPPRTILPGSTNPSETSAGPELAAGPDGLVCAACDWATMPDSSGDMIGQVVAVCSTDAGRSFAAPVHLGSESSWIQLPGDVKANGSPAVAISPRGDALYVAFTKHQPGAVHSDIVVTASRDRGRTWSKAVTATPADGVTYFQPNLAVDDAGRVAISAFALADGRVNQVLLVSQPQGELRFRPPMQVTTSAFDPHSPTASGQKHGAWWIGDYQGITASAGAFHLVWNDTRTGKLDLFAATVHP
jgi:hypothetical protein